MENNLVRWPLNPSRAKKPFVKLVPMDLRGSKLGNKELIP